MNNKIKDAYRLFLYLIPHGDYMINVEGIWDTLVSYDGAPSYSEYNNFLGRYLI